MVWAIPYFHNGWVQFLCALPPVVIGALHFGKSAFNSLKVGMPNMDVLVSMGSFSALVYSIILVLEHADHGHYYFETAATIISLVLLGNQIEARALSKTSIQMKGTAALLPSKAKVLSNPQTSQFTEIDTALIKNKDIVLVTEGEKVPADGKIISGSGELDESIITGESVPVFKTTGDRLLAGSVVVSGNFKSEVTQTGQNTLSGQISKWIKSAQGNKPDIQKIGDKVSGIFVQVVVSLAVITFVVNMLFGISLENSLLRAIAVLVVSCPCAMGLATPTAVSVGLGMAAKRGILVGGGLALEKFAGVKNLCLDKTGTITTGNFLVRQFESANETKDWKNIVWQMEQYSSHPIAKSILNNHKDWESSPVSFETIEEQKGKGIFAKLNSGESLLLGAKRLNPNENETLPEADIYLWVNNELCAWFSIKDEPVPELNETLNYFKEQQVKLHLISGDKRSKVEETSKGLPFENIYPETLPETKMDILQSLRKEGLTAMTGDGINDAPALAASDVAIALGHGSDLSKQQADIIVMGNSMNQLREIHKISKITLMGIRQNLFWAFAYNVVAIPIAALGYLNPTWAALFMAFSDLVVIGNSLRLRFKHI
jgi:P-type Cu+ transporter